VNGRATIGRGTRFALWAPVVLYMSLIFAISSVSQPPEAPPAITDKGAHAVLYSGLGALFVRALAGGWTRPVTWRIAAAAVMYSALYGVSDEVHQYFVPAREVEMLDVVADTIGAALAAIALAAWTIIRGRHGL
jgi:VanZ family protein